MSEKRADLLNRLLSAGTYTADPAGFLREGEGVGSCGKLHLTWVVQGRCANPGASVEERFRKNH